MEIKVHVTPGVRKERIEQKGVGTYTVAVREKALHNEANTRVREIVAEMHGVPKTRVRMTRGARSSRKVFNIT